MAVLAAVLSSPALAAGDPAHQLEAAGPDTGEGGAGWIAVHGPRTRQWLAPGRHGPHLTVDVALPEMALGSTQVETFRWERRDVLAGGGDTTRYQVLGARHVHEGERAGAFVGAHLMSWAGRASVLTPWLGARLGAADGASLRLEARLAGLGLLGARADSPLSGATLSLRAAAPRMGRWQPQARARWCDRGAAAADGADAMSSAAGAAAAPRREALLTLGVELERGRGRLRQPVFLGVGVRDAGEEGRALLVHLDLTAPMLGAR